MTREDTIRIMSVLRGAYPAFYRNTTKAEGKDIVDLWATLFADDDPVLVAAAVQTLIVTDDKGFPPVIGQIKAKMRQIATPYKMDEAEAWSLVAKALRNSAYESEKEFNALPPDIQRIVGSHHQLHDWSQMDSDTVHSVVASNFQRAFRVRKAAAEEYAALPPSVTAMMKNTKLLEERT